jgi:hypothetical protein
MKIIAMICLAFTFFVPSVYGADKILKLSTKTLSPSKVKNNQNERFRETALNYYATLLCVENIGDVVDLKIKIGRPNLRELPGEDKIFHEEIDITKEQMEKMGNDFGAPFPCCIITSNSFMPGEEILVVVEGKNCKSAPLKINPHPLEMKSAIDNACVTVRLLSIATSNFSFTFDGFSPNEKIAMISKNCGETISHKFIVNSQTAFLLACGVIGSKGGLDTVIFTRPNGEVLEITIPWGTDLIEHLYGGKKGIEGKRR